MIEIIGENMNVVFERLNIPYSQTYSGDIGYWPKFGVYEISIDDLIWINVFSEETWAKEFPDSWWRYADGSNMGSPNCEFEINGHLIDAWQNEYHVDDLVDEYRRLPSYEQSEYEAHGGVEDYITDNYQYAHKDLLTYFCDELHVSTERNVCALAVDLAKYNEMSLAELFRIYGGSK